MNYFTNSRIPGMNYEGIHSPIQWEAGALSQGVKWLQCEADH
jgi:hypothetical protein